MDYGVSSYREFRVILSVEYTTIAIECQEYGVCSYREYMYVLAIESIELHRE